MTSFLLDTQALLWWVAGDQRVAPELRAELDEDDALVYVSAAPAWEVATKARLGRPEAGPLGQGFAAEIERQGFLPLPISREHAERAGLLPPVHRDPFDRMLIAQAQAGNLRLVSKERVFDPNGVVRVW